MENSKLLCSEEYLKGADRSLPAREEAGAPDLPHPAPGMGVATTCIEHAYGSTFRLSFQIKVF